MGTPLRGLLVVENHPATAAHLVTLLEHDYPGVPALLVRSAEQAIQALNRDGAPLALLIDMRLPGMSGIAATRCIRQQVTRFPIIVMSLHDSQQHRQEANDAGADAFLYKLSLAVELPGLLSRLCGLRPFKDS